MSEKLPKPESLSRRGFLKETVAFGAGLAIGAGALEKHLSEKLSELPELPDHSLTESDKAIESHGSIWRKEQIDNWRKAIESDENLSNDSETIKELDKLILDMLKEFNYLKDKVGTLPAESENGMANIRRQDALERYDVLQRRMEEARENLLFIRNHIQKQQGRSKNQSATLSER